ncbi:achaete-scute homolog 2-like, partial [Pollicipes pollicipes]|uniref:achaete-scute homolog 2-like n=1 Tax=Pollicipes pollicipes TaxID=41117 RepID=UPI00188594CB
MATIYAVVSPHSKIHIKTEVLSPHSTTRTPTPQRPLRPINKDGEPGKARRQLAMNLNKGGPVINNRRNARERNRVKQVNQGFAVLRAHLPAAPKSKKISKVDTLRGAIDYIQGLSELLAASERYEAASFSPAEPPPPPAELYASASAFHSPGYGLAAYP